MVFLSILLITSMLFFKLTVAPFHLWAPDVYEGAPISSTIILSTIPKLILLTILMRWMAVTYYIFIDFTYLFLILGSLSIFFGIFFANRQKRLKRFIAYSSISQLGYAIILLSMINYDTYTGVYFFIVIYLIASIALWSFVALFNCFRTKTSELYLKESTSFYLSNLAHYVKYNKGWAFALLIIFASMAGIPPFSGFLPKVFVFIALTESSKWFLNILLVILTCTIIWYYVNVITILFMEVKSKFTKSESSLQIIHSKMYLDEVDYLIGCVGIFLLIVLFINPSFLYLICQYFTIYIL
jgi:NADH-quinone oxidoreductase subunit N